MRMSQLGAGWPDVTYENSPNKFIILPKLIYFKLDGQKVPRVDFY